MSQKDDVITHNRSQQTQNILYNFSLRRWSNIVQMLYKCFVFAGILLAPYWAHAKQEELTWPVFYLSCLW